MPSTITDDGCISGFLAQNRSHFLGGSIHYRGMRYWGDYRTNGSVTSRLDFTIRSRDGEWVDLHTLFDHFVTEESISMALSRVAHDYNVRTYF